MGKGYMSNTPFQIEKVNGSNTKRKSCFNCKYYDEGSCTLKMARITLNNAQICNGFENAYTRIDFNELKKERLTTYKLEDNKFDSSNKKYSECNKYTKREMLNNKKRRLEEEKRRAKKRRKKHKEKELKSEFITYIKQINCKIKNTKDIEKQKKMIQEKDQAKIIFSNKYPHLYKKIQRRPEKIL